MWDDKAKTKLTAISYEHECVCMYIAYGSVLLNSPICDNEAKVESKVAHIDIQTCLWLVH